MTQVQRVNYNAGSVFCPIFILFAVRGLVTMTGGFVRIENMETEGGGKYRDTLSISLEQARMSPHLKKFLRHKAR